MECNEDEEILHNEEITNIERKIHKLPNYDCAIIYNFLNFPKKKEIIKSCKLHDFMEMIEYTDFKNGIDLFASEINEFEILAYGGMFENDNKLDFLKQ